MAETTLGKMLDKNKALDAEAVLYLRNSNVQWGRVDLDDVKQMRIPADELEFFALMPGDLLVCEGGEIGRAAIWRGSAEYMAFQKALHRVRPNEAATAEYLCHFLEYLAITGGFDKLSTGTTIKHLPQQQLRQIPIPLPPINEQRRIVETLEDHLSRLDAAHGILRANLRRCRALEAAIIDQAVRGALLEFDSAVEIRDYANSLSETRTSMTSRRSAPTKATPSFDIALPKNWIAMSVDEITWSIEYGTSAKAHTDHAPGDIPVIRMGNIQNRELDWGSLKYLPASHPDVQKLALADGDILFNRTNSAELVGKAAVYREDFGPATFASYLIRCRVLPEVEPDWVNLVINSPIGRSYLKSVVTQQVGQANINGTKLAAMPIPLPTLDEQRAVLEIASELLNGQKRLVNALTRALSRTKQLRRALLAEAFWGRLVPQDPKDEPASELLRRIGAKHEDQPRRGRGHKPVADRSAAARLKMSLVSAGIQEELPL